MAPGASFVIRAFIPALLFCAAALVLDMRVAGVRPSVALFTQIFAAICAVLSAALWAQRRQNSEYGWLALVASGWALFAAGDNTSGVHPRLSIWLFSAGPLIMAGLTFLFLQSYFDNHRLSLRQLWWLLPLAILIAGGVALRGVNSDGIFPETARMTGLLLLATVCAEGAYRAVQQDSYSSWGVGAGLALLVLALADAGATVGAYRFVQPQVVIYGAAMFVGLFAWLLLSAFIDNLRHTEALNVELDQLVKERTQALTEQHQQVQTMQRAQVLATERERIMRDMHDGVGGQLVSTLAMIDGEGCSTDTLRDALDEALTDMRLMVDSLAPVNNDLNAVLATFRERMQPRLDAAGVTLKWQVAPIPPVEGLSPTSVLNVLRILQETFTNALKHAQADTIVVSTEESATADDCVITVRDNGVGFDPASANGGYGLSNMRQRAAECGFDYCLDSQSGAGTITTLSFAANQGNGGAT